MTVMLACQTMPPQHSLWNNCNCDWKINNCNLTETDNWKRKTLTETEKSKLKWHCNRLSRRSMTPSVYLYNLIKSSTRRLSVTPYSSGPCLAALGYFKTFCYRLSYRCSGLLVFYRTRNWEVAGSTHTRSTASNREQVVNVLRVQANSAFYARWHGKWAVAYLL